MRAWIGDIKADVAATLGKTLAIRFCPFSLFVSLLSLLSAVTTSDQAKTRAKMAPSPVPSLVCTLPSG
jgi:hypothetical protein